MLPFYTSIIAAVNCVILLKLSLKPLAENKTFVMSHSQMSNSSIDTNTNCDCFLALAWLSL